MCYCFELRSKMQLSEGARMGWDATAGYSEPSIEAEMSG